MVVILASLCLLSLALVTVRMGWCEMVSRPWRSGEMDPAEAGGGWVAGQCEAYDTHLCTPASTPAAAASAATNASGSESFIVVGRMQEEREVVRMERWVWGREMVSSERCEWLAQGPSAKTRVDGWLWAGRGRPLTQGPGGWMRVD